MRRWRLMALILPMMLLSVVRSSLSVRAQGATGVPVVAGAHQAAASVGRAGARLTLRVGFVVEIPEGVFDTPQQVTLGIASARAEAHALVQGFVPIGPTVSFNARFSSPGRPALVSYAAEHFMPRAGHKLVLALERSAQGKPAGWELVSASYGRGACRAELELAHGGRMQFGSVPQ